MFRVNEHILVDGSNYQVKFDIQFKGPRSRQPSVDGDHLPPMNTEEVYQNLRKTTAEIQNYSFGTKLGRDTNSKDSGISQMDDLQTAIAVTDQMHQHHIYGTQQHTTNGVNNYFMSLERDDSYSNSKTQSTATTESNTPENTARVDTHHTISEVSQRIATGPKHSDNVRFLANGELVTECKTLRHL